MDISKPILITGANGYIGSSLLREILALGARDVYCLTSQPRSSFSSPFWIGCDITDRDKVFEIFAKIRPAYVFHLAAIGTKTTQLSSSLANLLSVNAFGTQNLIDAAIHFGDCEGFINISTAYEYGPHKKIISEATDLSPYGNYAISKYVGSAYLDEKIHTIGFPGITYRLFSVYGPRDSGRIIPLIIDALKTGKPLHLFDIYRKRDFVHIDTVIAALLLFDKIRENRINSVNIGSGESLDVYNLTYAIVRMLELPIGDNIIFELSDKIDLHWECDNTLLRDYVDPIGLDRGLTSVLSS